MAALDEPEQYRFTRDGVDTNRSNTSAVLTSWADTLKGPLYLRYLERIGVAAGNRGLAIYRARHATGLKPGLTRKGKAIDERDRN